MNKAHRDRIAFIRICSGKFEKGMEVEHVQGGRRMKLSQPQQMMAQSREIIEEAYAGDIIGVFDQGRNCAFRAFPPLRQSCSAWCGKRTP